MKKAVVFLFVFMCFTLCGCEFLGLTQNISKDGNVDMTPRQIAVNQGADTVQMIEQVKSAVVGIKANVNGGYSIGSGVAIRDGGYILTNQHVVSGAKNLVVYFADKSTSSASVIWQDYSQDLAVIKSEVNIPYLVCSNNYPSVGEDVIAIGTPLTLDFGHTVTKGIVSALNRTLKVENSNGTITYMQNLIQHDASINPGNSGGPIINSSGEVVGINTLKASDAEGIGFAIPISMGQTAVNRLANNTDWQPSYLGVLAVDLDVAYIEGENVGLSGGVYIKDINQNSVCKDCLKNGDIITQINNQKINSVLDLRLCLYKLNAGDGAIIKILREGNEMEVRINMIQKV